MKKVTAWRINTWFSLNSHIVLWMMLTVAVGLLSFPSTEPAAAGFFWISILAFFGGTIAASPWYDIEPKTIYVQVAVNLLGIALQIYLIVCHWDTLCAIDEVLRRVRCTFVSWIYPDHRIFAWIPWAVLTLLLLRSMVKQGYVLWWPPKRPAWDIGE